MNNDRRLLLYVLAALLLTVVLTAALPNFAPSPSRIADLDLPTLDARPSASDSLGLVVLGAIPLFVVMVVLLLPVLRSRRALAVIGTLALALLFFAWSIVSFLPSNFVVTPTPTPTPNPQAVVPTRQPEVIPTLQPVEPPDPFLRPPAWATLFISGLFSALLVAGGVYLLIRYMRAAQPPVLSDLGEIGREASVALEALESGETLRNVVLRCYVDMSNVLKRTRQIEREAAMTPSEFAARLAALGLPEKPVAGLTRLFEAVRYGSAETTPADEALAVESLTAIVAATRSPQEAT